MKINREEYNRLDLQEALNYDSVTTYKCETLTCEEFNKEVIVDSREHSAVFIYANKRMKDGRVVLRHVINTSVCGKCMVVMTEVDSEFHKKENIPKYQVYAKKAKGDRSKNYFRDFTKTESNTQADPDVGKDKTELTKEDIARFEKNMKGKI